MSLIQPLPQGPLDIVGDIHGEYDALQSLLHHLGYDQAGVHPEGRSLVFVGDFCDRGPNSPAVLALAQRLVKSGKAVAVLGNHEINLLREEAKDGSGWFFDSRKTRDREKYEPYHRPSEDERSHIVAFLNSLPIALEREDLRIVHAAWETAQIEMVRALPIGCVRKRYDQWEEAAKRHALETDLQMRMAADLAKWEDRQSSHRYHLTQRLGRAQCHLDQRLRSARRRGAPLLPVLQCAHRHTQQLSKLWLRYPDLGTCIRRCGQLNPMHTPSTACLHVTYRLQQIGLELCHLWVNVGRHFVSPVLRH